MSADPAPWWREPFRTFQTNLRRIDPAALDVEKVLDFIEDYGADTWLISVGGIVANYPSVLDCQTVNPGLAERVSGDLIGDAVEAAAGRGIRVLARMDFSKIDARRAERYPQWCFVGPDGNPQDYNGYRSVCPSGDYYQRHMFDVVAEVLSRYDIRGFFFNMMHFNETDYSRRYRGVCQCESCRRAFGTYAPGVELPTGPTSPGYAMWQTFSIQVLEDLNRRMSEHISRLSPNAALILKDSADATYFEAQNAVGRPLWHTKTSEWVSAIRTADPERPVFVNCVGFVDMPYRWAGEDPHHFAQHLVQAIAHGGSPSTYVMGLPETGGYDCLQVGSRITRFHRDHSAIYRGLRSAARVGLVRGASSDEHHRRQEEFRGFFQMLLESHIPFDSLRSDLLSAAVGQRYDLLILPDLGPLTDGTLGAVEAVLAAGGAVVATGDSGWHDGALQMGAAEPLATQVAQHATQQSLFSLHVPIGGGHAPVLGAVQIWQAAPGVDTDWHLLGRSTYGPPELCYGNEPTSHPGWVAGSASGGRLGLVPWRPGLVYHQLGLQRVREAVVTKLLGLSRRPAALRLEADLPSQVQVVLGRNRAGSVIVHLLNRSGDVSQRFAEPLPIPAGRLGVPVPAEPVAVRSLVAGRELEWSRRGTQVEVHTPDLALFDVIEIRLNDN